MIRLHVKYDMWMFTDSPKKRSLCVTCTKGVGFRSWQAKHHFFLQYPWHFLNLFCDSTFLGFDTFIQNSSLRFPKSFYLSHRSIIIVVHTNWFWFLFARLVTSSVEDVAVICDTYHSALMSSIKIVCIFICIPMSFSTFITVSRIGS